MSRRRRDSRRFDGQRTDGVVRTVVGAGLADGQHLEDVEMMLVAPINHLAHAVGVAHAEVMFGADGEDRLQDAGQGLVRTQFHRAQSLAKGQGNSRRTNMRGRGTGYVVRYLSLELTRVCAMHMLRSHSDGEEFWPQLSFTKLPAVSIREDFCHSCFTVSRFLEGQCTVVDQRHSRNDEHAGHLPCCG